MNKDVIISIYGLQDAEGNQPDHVTLVTQGKYSRKGKDYFVSYDESALTGLHGTRTTLKIGEASVAVTRTGNYPSQMIFEKGRRHNSLYHTDYGDLIVAVNTHTIKKNLDDDGGSVVVHYAVEIDHALAGTNHLKVDIKSAADFGRDAAVEG